MDLHILPLIQAVAHCGSLTAAALQLNQSKSQVSASLKAFEQQLGVALFRRTTRQVSLTAAGEQLLQQCWPLYLQLVQQMQQIQCSDQALTGRLVITAPEDYVSQVLTPMLCEFSQQHPKLQFELRSSDSIRDLVKEGIDVAIRGGWLRDSSLKAQRIGDLTQWFVVSPQFVEQHGGLPAIPADLVHWPMVAFSQLRQPLDWLLQQGQQQVQLQFSGQFHVSSTASLTRLVVAGVGLGVLTDYAAQPLIDSGQLIRLLPSWQLPSGGIFAVYPPGQHRPLRVARFIQALQSYLQARS